MVSSVPCHICHQPVALENARVNEQGKAVHEECYVRSIKIVSSSAKQNPSEPGTAA